MLESNAPKVGCQTLGTFGKTFLVFVDESKIAALRRIGSRRRHDHGRNIEIEALTRRGSRRAFVSERRESGVRGAVVAAPSDQMSHLNGNVRSKRQYPVSYTH